MNSEQFNLIKAVVGIGKALQAKDRRIAELEAEVRRLQRAGYYPLSSWGAKEETGAYHRIDGVHEGTEWRYASTADVRCVQIRQQVRSLDRYHTVEVPMEIIYRLGELNRSARDFLLHWADMLRNPD